MTSPSPDIVLSYRFTMYTQYYVLCTSSDTGTDPPESCIFGQFLNFTAMMGEITYSVLDQASKLCTNTSASYLLELESKIAQTLWSDICNITCSIIEILPSTSLLTEAKSLQCNHVNPHFHAIYHLVALTSYRYLKSLYIYIYLFVFIPLAMATMYVRYKLVQAFNNHDIPLRRLNQIALFFGACSSLGVSLVANFQVRISFLLPVNAFENLNGEISLVPCRQI